METKEEEKTKRNEVKHKKKVHEANLCENDKFEMEKQIAYKIKMPQKEKRGTNASKLVLQWSLCGGNG